MSSEPNSDINENIDTDTNTNYNSNSESFINQVTLQFLMNKNQFSKYIEKKTSDSISKRERKHYSQRFLKLTKRMLLKKKSVDDMPSDIKFAFESFLKSCIHHFKMTDHTELVQAEYDKEDVVTSLEEEVAVEDETVAELEEEEVASLEEVAIEEEEEEVAGLEEDEKMRSLKVKMENMYLDNFVKSTTSDIFVPHQKNVVLENDSEKKEKKEKGKKKTVDKLRKKKNIDINYEDIKNEKDS
jgi:hypothetical protein